MKRIHSSLLGAGFQAMSLVRTPAGLSQTPLVNNYNSLICAKAIYNFVQIKLKLNIPGHTVCGLGPGLFTTSQPGVDTVSINHHHQHRCCQTLKSVLLFAAVLPLSLQRGPEATLRPSRHSNRQQNPAYRISAFSTTTTSV